jgi:putative spermidine/putrescine transport system substrate-binding protein
MNVEKGELRRPPRAGCARQAARSMSALLLAATSLAAQANCYPGTPGRPLEPSIVIDTTGGSTWDAFRKAVVEPFSKVCGVQVKMTVLRQRPTMPQMRAFLDSWAPPWDISFTNNPWELSVGMKQNVFEPLPKGFWKGIEGDLIPDFYNDYGTVIDVFSLLPIYNPKMVKEDMRTWADFWDVKKYPGQRSLADNPMNIVAALLADGVRPGDVYPITDDKLRRAFIKLDVLRPHIRNFWTSGDQPVQDVHKGELVAASAFSGRAFAGSEAKLNVRAVHAGQIVSSVWLFRPRGAKSPNAAAALMHYFNSNVDAQSNFAKLTGYSAARKNIENSVPPHVAAFLPTTRKNLESASVMDPVWWEMNGARAQTLWKQWVATGKAAI